MGNNRLKQKSRIILGNDVCGSWTTQFCEAIWGFGWAQKCGSTVLEGKALTEITQVDFLVCPIDFLGVEVEQLRCAVPLSPLSPLCQGCSSPWVTQDGPGSSQGADMLIQALIKKKQKEFSPVYWISLVKLIQTRWGKTFFLKIFFWWLHRDNQILFMHRMVSTGGKGEGVCVKSFVSSGVWGFFWSSPDVSVIKVWQQRGSHPAQDVCVQRTGLGML